MSGGESAAQSLRKPHKRSQTQVRDRLRRALELRAQLLASLAAVAIAAGGLLHATGANSAGSDVWGAAIALLAAELAVEIVRTVRTEHSLGVDTIALVAMVGHDAFSVTSLEVRAGEPVKLVIDNTDTAKHSITSPSAGVNVVARPGHPHLHPARTQAGLSSSGIALPV